MMEGYPPNKEGGGKGRERRGGARSGGKNYIQPPFMDVDRFLKEVVKPMMKNDEK